MSLMKKAQKKNIFFNFLLEKELNEKMCPFKKSPCLFQIKIKLIIEKYLYLHYHSDIIKIKVKIMVKIKVKMKVITEVIRIRNQQS